MSEYPDPFTSPGPPLPPYSGMSNSPYAGPWTGDVAWVGKRVRPTARRAGITMIVVSVFFLLGAAVLIFLFKPYFSELAPDQRAHFEQAVAGKGVTIEELAVFTGVFMAFLGLLYLCFGLLVRRGGRGWVIGSLVFNILMTLLMLMYLFQGFASPDAAGGVCFFGVLLVVQGFLVRWLISALRLQTPEEIQMQQQANYWAALQQQAFPGGGGYSGQGGQGSPWGQAEWGYASPAANYPTGPTAAQQPPQDANPAQQSSPPDPPAA